MTERFFFSQDNDCHWYIIPADRRDEWDAWREIPEDDERAWEPPGFAKALGGGIQYITFTEPSDVG